MLARAWHQQFLNIAKVKQRLMGTMMYEKLNSILNDTRYNLKSLGTIVCIGLAEPGPFPTLDVISYLQLWMRLFVYSLLHPIPSSFHFPL